MDNNRLIGGLFDYLSRLILLFIFVFVDKYDANGCGNDDDYHHNKHPAGEAVFFHNMGQGKALSVIGPFAVSVGCHDLIVFVVNALHEGNRALYRRGFAVVRGAGKAYLIPCLGNLRHGSFDTVC